MSKSEDPSTPLMDLDAMLSTLTVSQRPGTFCIASVDAATTLGDGVEALMVEDEGITAICTIDRAESARWDHEFPCAWLTLNVYSALEAVGLTAAIARVLTAAEIPCNVIAARHHDHLLVPIDQANEATAAIHALSH